MSGLIREYQTGAFQPLLPHLKAILKVAVVVLVRFRMNHNGMTHSGTFHAFQQMFRRGRRFGTIRCRGMVGKARILRACETMQMCVDYRRGLGRAMGG